MFLFLFFLSFILSCGIKGSPKPLPEPEFTLKRIGDYVYVIGKDIYVEGFQKYKSFWYKKEKKAFCFYVKRINGKEKKVCAPQAILTKPQISYKYDKEYLLIKAKEESAYNIYPYEKGILIPFPLKTFREVAKLERKYADYEVGITRVLSSRVESYPLKIKVKRKPYPAPEPPYSAGYVISEGKLILYWFHKDIEDLKGFYIYKNGKKVNKKPVKRNVYIDNAPEVRTVYGITAVNAFGIESKPLTLEVSPEAFRKP
ncbi:hypothetical protein [Aquifex sp.]